MSLQEQRKSRGDVLRAGTHYEVALNSAQKALKRGTLSSNGF